MGERPRRQYGSYTDKKQLVPPSYEQSFCLRVEDERNNSQEKRIKQPLFPKASWEIGGLRGEPDLNERSKERRFSAGTENVGMLNSSEIRVQKGIVGYGSEGRIGCWTRGESMKPYGDKSMEKMAGGVAYV